MVRVALEMLRLEPEEETMQLCSALAQCARSGGGLSGRKTMYAMFLAPNLEARVVFAKTWLD
eukprot:181431-Amphidinium_carterae.1